MLLFTRIHAFAALILASELSSSAALAEEAVRDERQVSSNRNTDAAGARSPAAPSAGTATPIGMPVPVGYPFRIQSPDATRRIEIRSMYDTAIARCVGGCILSLPESSYKAVFLDAQGHEREVQFDVQGPGGVELQDADESAATTGLVLGVAGPILIVGGYALLISGLAHSCLGASECTDRSGTSEQAMFMGGLTAIAAGAVMTPIGWVVYARNRHPRARGLSTSVSVVAGPSHDGAFLGLAGRF